MTPKVTLVLNGILSVLLLGVLAVFGQWQFALYWFSGFFMAWSTATALHRVAFPEAYIRPAT